MKLIKLMSAIAIVAVLTLISCKKKEVADVKGNFAIDSTKFDAFFQKHPDFKDFRSDIEALYREYDYNYVWYDDEGRNDFAEVLYGRARMIGTEGIPVKLPYMEEYEKLFDRNSDKPNLDNELLISSMYFFYGKKVLTGVVDPKKSKQMGWYLPRKKVPLVDYLEELMKEPDLIKKDTDENIAMYYNLRKGLQRYREIAKKGGWGTITLPPGTKSIRPGDNSPAVAQLRKRLFMSGDLESNNGSTSYDLPLVTAVQIWQTNHNLTADGIVGPNLIKELNIPVLNRIQTIIVNMERCRWLSPDITDVEEYIGVNIPSFKMRYVKDGKTELESNVVVGDEANKTVVFSGKMSYLVFSPYWNVPKSIKEKEILPGIEEDPEYLEKHNMEWDGENIRQRPGKDNSLGLVKFMFPNSNNIYLHDTPAKSLFKMEDRAESHGCIRVEKARELAIRLLDDERNWTPQKVDEAMNSGEEKSYPLKRKIPVYIAYFTAIADASGRVAFFDDIYKRDARLSKVLYTDAQ